MFFLLPAAARSERASARRVPRFLSFLFLRAHSGGRIFPLPIFPFMSAPKSRRVFLTVEIQTDLPLVVLRDLWKMQFEEDCGGSEMETHTITTNEGAHGQIVQVQCNVAAASLKGRHK